MKSLVAAGLGVLFLLTGIAGWLDSNGFHPNLAWNHKAIANVHEASLLVGIMLVDERRAYKAGLEQVAAQHKRLDKYTIYEVMKLGDRLLQQRRAGISETEINEESDLDSAIKLINVKKQIVQEYKIARNRLVVTMNADVSDADEQFARDELRSVWAVSYNQRHHWHGAQPIFTTAK